MGCFLVAVAGGEDAVNARNTHTTAKFVIGHFVTLAALSPGRAFPQGSTARACRVRRDLANDVVKTARGAVP